MGPIDDTVVAGTVLLTGVMTLGFLTFHYAARMTGSIPGWLIAGFFLVSFVSLVLPRGEFILREWEKPWQHHPFADLVDVVVGTLVSAVVMVLGFVALFRIDDGTGRVGNWDNAGIFLTALVVMVVLAVMVKKIPDWVETIEFDRFRYAMRNAMISAGLLALGVIALWIVTEHAIWAWNWLNATFVLMVLSVLVAFGSSRLYYGDPVGWGHVGMMLSVLVMVLGVIALRGLDKTVGWAWSWAPVELLLRGLGAWWVVLGASRVRPRETRPESVWS